MSKVIERREDSPPPWLKYAKIITVIIPLAFIGWQVYLMNTWSGNQEAEAATQPKEAEVLPAPVDKKDKIPAPVFDIVSPKSDVFYIGVNNPISVLIHGEPVEQSEVKLQCVGCRISKKFQKKYVVTVTEKKKHCTVRASINGENYQKEFAILPIPNPHAELGKYKAGDISIEDFKTQRGLLAVHENFDYDVICTVRSFEVKHLAKGQKMVGRKVNKGSVFTSSVQKEITSAKTGDTYAFTKIKVRCPGDSKGRVIEDSFFKIK